MKEKYIKEVVPKMMADFKYKNSLSVPKIEKITLNVGDSVVFKRKGKLTDGKIIGVNSNLVIVEFDGDRKVELKYDEVTHMSLVKIDLKTGRHHQIRVQFSSRRHSLCGDTKYGTRSRSKQLALWSYRLKFYHPTTKEELEEVQKLLAC